jgi:hypothetical protein
MREHAHVGIMIFDAYNWVHRRFDAARHPQPGIDAFLEVYAPYSKILRKEYPLLLQKTADHLPRR